MRKPSTILIVVIILWVSVIVSLILNFTFDLEFILGISSLTIVSATIIIDKFKNARLLLLLISLFLSIFDLITFCYGFTLGIFPGLLPINIVSFLLFTLLAYRERNKILQLKGNYK
jgi:Na+-translocating ferredoxin:NAD+ oxidoreductase RnfE subunit